jgi:hypothetical protein
MGALGALALACRASGGSKFPTTDSPPRHELLPADSAVLPAVKALSAALASGNDALARGLVASLRKRTLLPEEKALLDSAEKVLTGRELVHTLELTLASEPVAGAEGRFVLVLRARTQHTSALHLRLPPADLKRLRANVNALGAEGLDYESKVTPVLRDLVLEPSLENRVELLTYELPLGRSLGVRERWRLETRSGEIEADGVRYPAANVKVNGCERERLSPLCAAEPVAPDALATRLASPQPPSMRELLELALRTPPEEREAGLAALAPIVAELARSAPERIARAEPALRWWTQNRELGNDAAAWARYLEARSSATHAAGEPSPDGLDLPAQRPTGKGSA